MDPSVSEREPKRLDQLVRGDWIKTDFEDFYAEAQVQHVEIPRPNPADSRAVLLYRPLGQAETHTIRLDRTKRLRLLTGEEMDRVIEAERREQIAEQFDRLANLFRQTSTPLPGIFQKIEVDIDYGTDAAAVVAMAKCLDSDDAPSAHGIQVAALVYGPEDFGAGVVTKVRAVRPAEPASDFVDGPCLDRDCPNASWPHSASSDLAEADPTGLSYSREADDPTPVSPARVPAHFADGRTGAEIEHFEARGWKGDVPGSAGVACACEVAFDGFDTLAEAKEQLAFHIEAATSPTGLTKAADETRGPLAFTTPVVAYFSFGHGQTDPDTGKSLLDHYVTVVAPTAEACREAMVASRFGWEWSSDYLAGQERATSWVRRWTEHEVIVAPGVDKFDAEAALVAANQVLDGASA